MPSVNRARLRTPSRLHIRMIVIGAATAILASAAATTGAAPPPGFKTDQAAMLSGAPGVTVTPLITVGETLGSYRFEAIPDGISVRGRSGGRVELFVNHETSTVPFPYTPYSAGPPELFPTIENSLNDFDNAQVSRLTLNDTTAGILSARMVIRSRENFQRFCSNFLATGAQGFDRPILFTNEEATDFVNRTGRAWPAPTSEPPAEQAGVVVAYDVRSGARKPIYGMGRHNHENSVAIPGYEDLVVLSGDDTFSAPSSQLYSYIADDTDDLWNDRGRLWAFVADDPATNDYGDLSSGESVSGRFIRVPRNIARGPQAPLETWSNENNVFQFIRLEDIAYDRNDPSIVYLADTGEPRAIPDATSGRLTRGASGTNGQYMNGRIFKLVLDPDNPRRVTSLSILIDADSGGYANPNVFHQPDNLETTGRSLLIQEDPGGHNQFPTSTGYPAFPDATNARIWKYDLRTGDLTVVATVDQSADEGPTDVDPATSPGGVGSWESSGIVDASAFFGRGWFFVDVQAHTLFVETGAGLDLTGPGNAPDGVPDWLNKREGGQLLLIRIPGA
jgi:hypothetical protein